MTHYNTKQKNILITGVAGLLGSRLADWIITNKPEYKVIGIDDLSGGFKENIHPDVDFHQLNLVDGAIDNDVKRLIFTSTLAVYGHGEGGIFHENQQPSPIDPYGVAKYACEMDIKIANEQHGLDYCIIRPHNVYGVKQNIWDNQPMTIFGDGEQTRAFSFIDDSIEPLFNAAIRPEASKETINLGGIEEISINNANKLLSKIIGEDIEVIHLEGRHEVKHSIPTFQKSIDLLDFEYKTTMYSGLTQMWEWAKKQPMRDRFEWSEYELDKGIYSFWKTK